MEQDRNRKVECDVCHRQLAFQYINTHKRRIHGIFVRRGYMGATLPAVVEKPVEKRTFKIMPFIVLEDQDGAIWIAEKMRDA
jgi:hypothetical protein